MTNIMPFLISKKKIVPENIISQRQQVDIGCSKLVVLSNGEEIPHLNLEKETDNIIKCQKIMSRHKKDSNRKI